MKRTLTLFTTLLLAPLATLSAALLLLPLARLHALCVAACRRLLAPVGLGNGAAVGYPVPAMETLPPTKPPTSGSVRNYALDWRSRMPAFLFAGLTRTSRGHPQFRAGIHEKKSSSGRSQPRPSNLESGDVTPFSRGKPNMRAVHAFLAVAATSLLSGMAEEATKVSDQPRPADPAFEKWLPMLNANPAAKPRPIPDPLPAVELVPGPFSSDRKAPCWKEFRGPQWLYDGKIGIGLHWGPASLEGKYAWPAWARYGEKMKELSAKYGHPSNMGWKDIANLWRAEKFDAMRLGALFKASGFTFVAAQAAHHDRFDMFDSTYRPWNSVNVGPHRDLLKEWRESCRANGLRFGITDHSDWQGHMGGAFGSDKDGPWAGVPYDGRLTRADGKGKWWDGLDPVDFYGPVKGNREFLDRQWYLRSLELIRKYQPDIWWQDGNFHNLGAEMARMFIASYYNLNAEQHGGKPEGIVIVKQHPSTPALMTNYEIHKSIQTPPHPWMTDTTCYGPWFYDESCERECMYTGETLVHLVADNVSRNGTLLLNVTLRPDGTLPQPQVTMLENFGRWMAMNGEAIHGTRPWHVFCDHGYSTAKPLDPSAWQKFKPGEIRYTSKGDDTLYAIVFGKPKDRVLLTQFCPTLGGGVMDREVAEVKLLGWDGKLTWKYEWPHNLEGSGLSISVPKDFAGEYATVFKIALKKE